MFLWSWVSCYLQIISKRINVINGAGHELKGNYSFTIYFDKTHQSEVKLDQTVSHVHNFGTQRSMTFYLILKLYTRYNLKECILLYSTQDKCRKNKRTLLLVNFSINRKKMFYLPLHGDFSFTRRNSKKYIILKWTSPKYKNALYYLWNHCFDESPILQYSTSKTQLCHTDDLSRF